MEKFEVSNFRNDIVQGRTLKVLSTVEQLLDGMLQKENTRELQSYRKRVLTLITDLSAMGAKADLLDSDFIANRRSDIEQETLALLLELEPKIDSKALLNDVESPVELNNNQDTDLEITIKKDFSKFTKEEQHEFMEAIGNFLKLSNHNIKIKRVDRR